MAEQQTVEPPMIVKRSRGRPSKYKPELIDKGWNYLQTYHDQGDKIPTLAGLGLALDLSEETIQQWKNDKNKRDFSVLCRALMQQQQRVLLNNGLDGTYNSNITKLVLSKHGYTENNQANQGAGGIQVIVNRDTVTVNTGDAVQDEVRRERVIEHE